MSQEIEIEFKTLLTKAEFETLLHALPFPEEAITQTNYYFETDDLAFKKQHSALRIRKKADKYTLTLKEPHAEGILETHDHLSANEFERWINNEPVPKDNVAKQLAALGLKESDLRYYGALQTARRTFTRNQIIYVLDKSTYNNITDYELEIEAPSKTIGQQALQDILTQYPVSKQQSITKIERFFSTLSSL